MGEMPISTNVIQTVPYYISSLISALMATGIQTANSKQTRLVQGGANGTFQHPHRRHWLLGLELACL